MAAIAISKKMKLSTICFWLRISVLLQLKYFCIDGVPVVQVQENGIFSGTSYLGRTVKLESPLEEFSICARISLNYLRGRNSYWLSVANEDSNDLIVGVFNNSYDAPMITMRRFHPKVLDEVSIELDKFDFQTWHSFCFVFDTQHQFPYPGGYTNLTNRAYIDGKLVSSDQKTIIKSSYVAIEKSFKLLLGQKIKQFSDSNFAADNSFSGRFTDVILYRGALDDSTIENYSNCRLTNVRNVVVVDWNVNAYNGNEIDVEDVPSDVLCTANREAENAIFNHGMSHAQAHLACEKLGGELPTFGKSFTDRTKTYKELSDVFEASVASVASCRLSENLNTDVANDKSVTVVLNLTVEDVDPIPRKGDLYFWDQFSKTIFA